jgi:hypothetical protein
MHRPHHTARVAAFALAAVTSALAAIAVAAAAPAPEPPPPPAPALQPVPETGGDVELEPQVTITKKDGETVEEARVNGKLLWIRVTPRHGRPYFLIPDSSDFGYIRRDSFDTGLKVPLWVLFTF